ncbi:MAG: hypothetical protein QM730_07695 [Anaerolineales bacterium]
MLAAPFVTPHNEDTNLAQELVWLPEGDWFNFFDGERFSGNRWHTIYGTLEDIPIFARAGAIVPLSASADVSVPDHLIVKIFPGMDGEFLLYEDDGVSGSYLDGAQQRELAWHRIGTRVASPSASKRLKATPDTCLRYGSLICTSTDSVNRKQSRYGSTARWWKRSPCGMRQRLC